MTSCAFTICRHNDSVCSHSGFVYSYRDSVTYTVTFCDSHNDYKCALLPRLCNIYIGSAWPQQWLCDTHNDALWCSEWFYVLHGDFMWHHDEYVWPHNDAVWPSKWLWGLHDDSVWPSKWHCVPHSKSLWPSQWHCESLQWLCVTFTMTLSDLHMFLCPHNESIWAHNEFVCPHNDSVYRHNEIWTLIMTMCDLTMTLCPAIMSLGALTMILSDTIMPYNHHMTLCYPNKDALWHSQWLWKPPKCLCATFPKAWCDLHNYLYLHNGFVCLSQWFWGHQNDLCALMFVCDPKWLHVPSSQCLCVTLTTRLYTLKTTSVLL